ncbi:MAG TPA: cytochrome c oxidase assembly factor Coa1 family protein [Candidatus Binataceae bacterium]|jgi:hypothetical protein|nr:cytochrome c oxidase assembly factor Coa1 family protein [Candidatus Binataceae bacterium]
MASAQMGNMADDSSSGGMMRFFASIGIVVALGVIGFVVWAYIRNSHMSMQAEKFAATFVQSSPRVAQDLGSVVSVKETREARINGPLSGWTVDMDVTGKKANGVVRMTLEKVKGEWNVPRATLVEPNAKPINLM